MTTLVAMTEAEYEGFLARAVPAFAKDKCESGAWTVEESLARSLQSFLELLPQGLETPDNHLFTIRGDGAVQVGALWFALEQRGGARVAYVYDIEVLPAYRRLGHARRALVALEGEARARGAAGVALHVFGHNAAARALYQALDYRPTNINLYKPV
jgi:ribosomal protein S18 acetylase RimI-like enzyme